MTDQEFDRKYRQIAFWIISGAAAIGALMLFMPFFGAIMWATVFSVLTFPLYKRFRRRWSESASSALTVLVTLGVIVIPTLLVGGLLFVKVSEGVKGLEASAPANEKGLSMEHLTSELDRTIKPMLDKVGATFSLSEFYASNREDLLKSARGFIGQAIVSIGTTLLTLVIALLTMFFMLRDGHRLLNPVLELIPLPHDDALSVLLQMAETIRAVFMGIVFVGVIQAALAGLSYWAAGMPNPFIWTCATFFFCLVPLVGAPGIYIPVGLLLLAQGNYVGGLIVLGWCLLVVSNIDNFLRPYYIGTRIERHYMAIFFSLLGGIILFGPIGLMAGPVLLTAILAVQDIIRQKRGAAAAEQAAAS